MKNKKRMVAIVSLILAAIMLITLLVGLIPTHTHAAKLTSAELEKYKEQLNEYKEERKEIQKEQAAIRDQISDNMSEMEKLVAEKAPLTRKSA
jgi:peptidoglycan hydrolase CwlO-like protein